MHPLQKNCKLVFWITLTAGITALWFFGLAQVPAAAQQLGSITPTATGTGANAYVSASSIEGFANVRSGPNSFDYPLVGTLLNGETAPAIGRSPAGEWIEIIFPAAPRGTGWVYVAYVTLSPPGTLLPIVEPPPTPAPLETPTLNPTFVAAFQTLATSTRLPTFTAPPPLAIPTFINRSNNVTGREITTLVVLGLGLLGLLGLAVTSFRRR